MKTRYLNKKKRPYKKPKIEKIEIDRQICLLMATGATDPPDPGGDPDPGGGGGGMFP